MTTITRCLALAAGLLAAGVLAAPAVAAPAAEPAPAAVVAALGQYTGTGTAADPYEALDLAVEDAATQAEEAGEDLETCEVVDYDVQPDEEGQFTGTVVVECGGDDGDGDGEGRPLRETFARR
ncbi:hypothetical protein GCM10010123_05730 [Pilimelia anulata]|uniref:Uncharacterized protein n=1 Tax=Pilimelia anulata TaxID=53371 RepID=A0A8J3B7H3_9ACTN|nr:hypothetical protein [Pilimelia anulata]GGJ78637.1 hypothetical protein GCM10010123_05730 [Pilimelia anulata]